jgi:uncharacterized membrane protein
MMAPAILCAGAYLGWIHLDGTPLAFMNSMIALTLFTLFAIGELIADKLPKTPARTSAMGLSARVLMGALCGAVLAASGGKSLAIGALLGAVGGIVGAFAGYHIRRGLVTHMKLPDFVVAVIEDLLAISGGLFIASRM